MRRHAEPGGDFLRAPSTIIRKLVEALELVGGMKVFAGDVLVKADLRRLVCRVDDAADRFGLLICLRFTRSNCASLRPSPMLTR